MLRGQAVGQVELEHYAIIDDMKIQLITIKEASTLGMYSSSYIRYMASVGQLIAFKFSNRWLVDKRLIKVSELAPVQTD